MTDVQRDGISIEEPGMMHTVWTTGRRALPIQTRRCAKMYMTRKRDRGIWRRRPAMITMSYMYQKKFAGSTLRAGAEDFGGRGIMFAGGDAAAGCSMAILGRKGSRRVCGRRAASSRCLVAGRVFLGLVLPAITLRFLTPLGDATLGFRGREAVVPASEGSLCAGSYSSSHSESLNAMMLYKGSQ